MRFLRRLSAAASALLATTLVMPTVVQSAPVARPDERIAERMRLDEEVDCSEWLPDTYGVAGVTDDGADVSLDILVLLDGVDVAAARSLMATAAGSYSPLGIVLHESFQSVVFEGNDAAGLIAQARRYVGGARPETVDVVHVLTAKPMTDPNTPPGTTIAGLADCIGGVKDPRHAFSVARVDFDPPADFGPVQVDVDTAARVTAHEIGHLLGAHHHYANCVEGTASELDELSPCTLMFNATNFGSANFSLTNGAMVRGHAVAYAAP